AERLGHRLPAHAWAVALEPDDAESESEIAVRGRQDRLDEALSDLVRRRAAGSLVLLRANSAVILVPEEAAADLAAVGRGAALAPARWASTSPRCPIAWSGYRP